MAEKAAGLGIKRILVTPHVGRAFGTRPESPSRKIAVAIAQLQADLDQSGIEIRLIPGAELTLSSVDFVKRIIDEPWLTFGIKQRYLLVESPLNSWPEWADQILFELSLQGIIPIIAHPERLVDVQKDPDFLRPLVERGALLQITARSLVSSQREIKKACRELLKLGFVSVIASDAHTSRHMMTCEVESELTAIVGEVAAQQILVENPRAILAGDALMTSSPAPLRKKGLAHFFNRS